MVFHPMTAAGVVTWFACWIWIMNNNVSTCNNGEKSEMLYFVYININSSSRGRSGRYRMVV